MHILVHEISARCHWGSLGICNNHAPYFINQSNTFNLARRICTIVSCENTKLARLDELKQFLIGRSYPIGLINKGIEMALAIDQNTLRTPRDRNEEQILPFVSTYNPSNTNMFSVIRENLPMLNGSERMTEALQDITLIHSNRQAPSLKRQITNARFITNTNTLYHAAKCNKPRCKCCENILEASQFTFRNTGMNLE